VTPSSDLAFEGDLGSRNFKFSPEYVIMMPSTGQIEKLDSLRLAGQIAQVERKGTGSGRLVAAR
jgi:hypothetical protein